MNKKLISLEVIFLLFLLSLSSLLRISNCNGSSFNPNVLQINSSSNETILFEDDFEDEDLTGWVLQDEASWAIVEAEGSHVLEGTDLQFAKTGENNWVVTNFEVMVTPFLYPLKIHFRDYSYLSIDGRYTIEIYEGTMRLRRFWQGTSITLAESQQSLEKENWYNFNIEFSGPDIFVYINHELVFHGIDEDFLLRGGIKIEAASAYFDNVKVFGTISTMGCDYADIGHPVSILDGYVASNIYTTQLLSPWDLVFGQDGYLYVAEFTGSRISKVSSEGVVSLYATIPDEYRGHTISLAFGPNEELYVIARENGEGSFTGILRILPDQTVTLFARSNAPPNYELDGLNQIAVNSSGDIFVGEFDGDISKITPDGEITTFATGFSVPTDLEFGPTGDLFVFDEGTGEISRIDSNGVISTYATGLPQQEGYMAFDPQGNIFVMQCYPIYLIPPNGSIIPVDPVPGLVPDCYKGIRFDSLGNMYAAGGTGSRIVKVLPDHTAIEFVTGFSSMGMALNPSNELFAIDTSSIKQNPITTDILKISDEGTATKFVTVPDIAMDIAFDDIGNMFVGTFDLLTPNSGKILKINAEGEISTFVTGLDIPCSLDFNPSGDLFVLESVLGDIIRITTEGNKTIFASGFSKPDVWFLSRLAVDSSGNIFVAFQGDNNTLYQILPNGTITVYTHNVVQAGFWDGGGIDVTPWGETFITEGGPGRLLRATQEGASLIATGITIDPHSLTCNPAGELFIARAGSVLKISPIIYVYRTYVSEKNAEVNSTQAIGFQAIWGHNSTVVNNGILQINGTNFHTNSTGWIEFEVSSQTVGQQTWMITGINCSGITGYLQMATNPVIFWNGITTPSTTPYLSTTEKSSSTTVIVFFGSLITISVFLITKKRKRI